MINKELKKINRTKELGAYFTSEEVAKIKQYSKLVGLGVSPLIRNILLEKINKEGNSVTLK